MLEHFHNDMLLGNAFISRKEEQSFFSGWEGRRPSYTLEHRIYSQTDQDEYHMISLM